MSIQDGPWIEQREFALRYWFGRKQFVAYWDSALPKFAGPDVLDQWTIAAMRAGFDPGLDADLKGKLTRPADEPKTATAENKPRIKP
jgi:hypothetical protein